MGHRIVKQPNGLYAVWSTVVDDFVMLDCTPEDIIADRVTESTEEIRTGVMKTITALDAGEKPYYQFTMTWEEALKTIASHHGKKHAREVAAMIDTINTEEGL